MQAVVNGFKNILFKKNILIIISSVVLSILVVGALGHGFSYVDIAFALAVLLIARKNPLSTYVIVFSCLFAAFYANVGFVFGPLNIGIIAALFETNVSETKEFFSMISWKYTLISVIMVVMSITYLRTRSTREKKSLYVLIIALLFLVTSFFSVFGIFFASLIYANTSYFSGRQQLAESLKVQPSWEITSTKNKYKNYVVIIGESMRKDYMSIYGYPLKTTPFLDSANGLFIDGYVAAAPNTSESLPRMMSITTGREQNIVPGYDIVSLALAAGFETYWLSNQGYLGAHDTSISKIAVRSENKVFLKGKGDFLYQNFDDFDLLPHLDSVLDEHPTQDKVIFIHIMGSHPHACGRLHGFKSDIKTGFGGHFDCYLATIQKTDLMLQKITERLTDAGQPFSLLYFSDHGMTVDKGDNWQDIRVGSEYRQNFEVPLIFISSDSNTHIDRKSALSAYNFIHLFASWIGVESNKIDKSYTWPDYPEDKKVMVYNFSKMVELSSMKSQPPFTPAN